MTGIVVFLKAYEMNLCLAHRFTNDCWVTGDLKEMNGGEKDGYH
ncbi:hypothetical protein [Rossellomorea marisflavi]|nr:hypothetical protein [Rossellomorea marisflavi]